MGDGHAEPLTPGEQLAHDLHSTLLETNRLLSDVCDLLKENIERQEKLADIMDDACAYMEVATTAADVLSDVAGNGKSLTSKDIVKAIQTATKEIFGDDDDDNDGGGGGDDKGDPDLVGGPTRRRRISGD